MDLCWTAFVLGFFGSLHCLGMCGPLALALPMPAGGGFGAYFAGRLAYNAGRIVTYALLGLVFGLLGRTLMLAGFQRWLSISLGILVLVGLIGSARLTAWVPVHRWIALLTARMSGLLRRRSMGSLGVLGLLNGLLPCGLVYVACAAAATTGSAWAGSRYMALFGLGTLPAMLAVSLSGRIVTPTLRRSLGSAIPVTMAIMAALLILRGLSLGVPYLSPDLSIGAPSCCHH